MQKQKMTYAHPQGLLNAALHRVSIMKNIRGERKCGHLNVLISVGSSIQIQVLMLLTATSIFMTIGVSPNHSVPLCCFEIELSFLLTVKCRGKEGEDKEVQFRGFCCCCLLFGVFLFLCL